MTIGVTLFILYSSWLTKLTCDWKVTRNVMEQWITSIHIHARRCYKNYWVVCGRKHSLTLHRGRYIARWKEIYKLHSRSYRTSRTLTRASNPSWRSLRNGGTSGRTVKLQVDGRLVADCEEETETALRHGIFFA